MSRRVTVATRLASSPKHEIRPHFNRYSCISLCPSPFFDTIRDGDAQLPHQVFNYSTAYPAGSYGFSVTAQREKQPHTLTDHHLQRPHSTILSCPTVFFEECCRALSPSTYTITLFATSASSRTTAVACKGIEPFFSWVKARRDYHYSNTPLVYASILSSNSLYSITPSITLQRLHSNPRVHAPHDVFPEQHLWS